MNKKIIIQLILFFIILLFLSIFYFKYFLKTEKENTQLQELNPSLKLDKDSSNTIKSIVYVSKDNFGNKYIIKAKYGEILDKNNNLIVMRDVKAMVILKNLEKIIISATSATYNIVNYDTNFKTNILVEYLDHKITCNSIDLLFNDHKIKLYDNINYMMS